MGYPARQEGEFGFAWRLLFASTLDLDLGRRIAKKRPRDGGFPREAISRDEASGNEFALIVEMRVAHAGDQGIRTFPKDGRIHVVGGEIHRKRDPVCLGFLIIVIEQMENVGRWGLERNRPYRHRFVGHRDGRKRLAFVGQGRNSRGQSPKESVPGFDDRRVAGDQGITKGIVKPSELMIRGLPFTAFDPFLGDGSFHQKGFPDFHARREGDVEAFRF